MTQTRDDFTRKLARMCETIDSGKLPSRVIAFYVFGSYSRGAVAPNDLDVVLIHEEPTPAEISKQAQPLIRDGVGLVDAHMRVYKRFRAGVTRALRKPAEKVDLLLAPKIEDVTGGHMTIKATDLVLLWSDSDRDWRKKLASIKVDPAAGGMERNHFASLKRFDDTLAEMERLMQMIEAGELILTRIPVEDLAPKLSVHHRRYLERQRTAKQAGRAVLTLLPYALGWLDLYRQLVGDGTNPRILWSSGSTHRVHLVKPSLEAVAGCLQMLPRLRRQCLIPCLRKDAPPELFQFERGPKWIQHPPRRRRRSPTT